jgi:hypothetical protein
MTTPSIAAARHFFSPRTCHHDVGVVATKNDLLSA